MKKNELNLDALENADENTIIRLSDSYTAVSDSDREKLFCKSERLYEERVTENDLDSDDNVSGVDVYRRPMWKKTLAIASAAVLAVVIGIGGVHMLNAHKQDNIMTETSESQEEAPAAPFGDISDGRVRFMTSAYAPYLLEADADAVKQLAEAFNSSAWEEADADAEIPDGEATAVYVYNNGQPFRLVFYGDRTVDYESGGELLKYRFSGTAADAVHTFAAPEDYNGKLIWCRPDSITPESVWENNEPVPETIFEIPAVPEEMEGKNIINCTPMFEYAYDIQKIENNALDSDNVIIGRVNDISYLSENGLAKTKINITVTGDLAGAVSEGEAVIAELYGGYISMRDQLDEITEWAAGGKYGDGTDMSDEEIDNTCYYEIVESGELPIIGKEYAFFVSAKRKGAYQIIGQEYGILYKSGNIYIQRNDQGYNFYSLDELKDMLGNR